MSPAIFLNPSPLFTQLHNFNRFPPLPFPALNVSKRKSVRLKKTMAVESFQIRIGAQRNDPAFEQETLIDNGGAGASFHQIAGGLHPILNRSSKWVVTATFVGMIVWRHDALVLWASMGSVVNAVLSMSLKRILKQERPAPDVSSGHGMPSSHAQSIFYATIFLIFSVVEWQGLTGLTAILSMLFIALGLYFSWLRVLLRYHTTSQVVVGAMVGSIFSMLWFWTWEAIVEQAYNSNLWVRILVIVGAASFYLGFASYVLRHWIKDDN